MDTSATFLGLIIILISSYQVSLHPVNQRCIDSCLGKANGNYASCHGCRFYVTCDRGQTFDKRLCPRNLSWDDNQRSCIASSKTCSHKRVSCVSNCVNKEDGTYHSCIGCSVFVTCRSGQLYDNLPCPQKLLWDDHRKRCERKSTTCMYLLSKSQSDGPRNRHDQNPDGEGLVDQNDPGKKKRSRIREEIILLIDSEANPDRNAEQTPLNCIRNCQDRLDGNYQSCFGCDFYASCKNGKMSDKRFCPSGTTWDDIQKSCAEYSSTCKAPSKNNLPAVGTCVDDCGGIDDGQYQSCKGCEFIVFCWNGRLDEIPCRRSGTGSFWDDRAKLCLPESSTCNPRKLTNSTSGVVVNKRTIPSGTCISTCDGIENGNYQSCISCRVFVTCKNGMLFDGRACEEGHIWDDKFKQCAATSTTCEVKSSSCIKSCDGVLDGNYPSCNGCRLFVTCFGGGQKLEKRCPGKLVWDDDLKLCVSISSTCSHRKTGGISSEEVTNPKENFDSTSHLTTTLIRQQNLTTLTPTRILSTTALPSTSTNEHLQNEDISYNEGSGANDTGTSRKTSCIRTCTDLPGGHYQSCFGCGIYIACFGGNLYVMSCLQGLVWDDVQRACLPESATCGPGFGACVEDCGTLWDGDYQSCKGCNMYMSCSNGKAHDSRRCPEGLVWDDLLKQCVKSSSTCAEIVLPHPPCTIACAGMKNGMYHSCVGCSSYVICEKGQLVETRNCSIGLSFDAIGRKCVTYSNTCGPGRGECITSCDDLPNGDYISCKGCSLYASCANGVLHDKRPCAKHMKWDDMTKRCVFDEDETCLTPEPSKTEADTVTATRAPPGDDSRFDKKLNFTHEGHVGDGRCISSCNGQLNGDYQSCKGCDVFVTCLNGVLYDRRPCPDGLVWEDSIKHCMDTSTTCGPGRGGCVSTCEGLNEGQYQSCRSCSVYVSCFNGVMEDDRPCPRSELWDDLKKRCVKTSTTCSGTHKSVVPAGVCIHDCEDIPDGEYQSCYGCTGYATCTKGVLQDSRPCPIGLVWDDIKKRCRYTSPTCGPGRGECTRSCIGLPDGDFQSCSGCRVYATCLDGVLHDNRPCPSSLVWDDSTKRCSRESHTCGQSGRRSGQTVSSDPALEFARRVGSSIRAISPSCVSSCEGKSNGDYQSCHDCRVYVTCTDGSLTDDRACPLSTLWDDNHKRCLRVSTTCSTVIVIDGNQGAPRQQFRQAPRHQYQPWARPQYHQTPQVHSHSHTGPGNNCIRDCDGRSNGDYQSCIDCRVYASCLHGTFHDNRACPLRTVWDDNKKRCLYSSATCHIPGYQNPTPNSPVPRQRPRRRRIDRRGHRRPGLHQLSRTVRVGECVQSCGGIPDGDYQSCYSCSTFVSCIRGHLFNDRRCPSGLMWNDAVRRCDFSSNTC